MIRPLIKPCVRFFSSFLLLFICYYATAQQRRFYLANDDHTDLMWTANDVKYDSAFVQMLDYYLAQIDSTINNPDDYQTRFNCDGAYWIRAYEKFRSPQQYQKLLSRLRSGHISAPLNYVVNTYGAQPTEAVLRGMYYAGQLERDNNLRFSLAVSMENQTIPLGLASLWAGSGAKYSWRGVCGCATRFTNESLKHRRNQLYNYTGLDGRGVVMKWYSRLIYNGRTLGGYAECRREGKPKDIVGDMSRVMTDLDQLCDSMTKTFRQPYNVAAAFGYGWDDLKTFVAPEFIQAAQRYTTPTRKVRVSNEADFFEDVIHSGLKLPTEKISYGNEWETYCASMNETTAKVRRSTEKLRSAEALAAVVAVDGNDVTRSLEKMRKNAWEGFGNYWEHDWTADGPVSQKDRAAWQIKQQQFISNYVDTLFAVSSKALATQLSSSTSPRFYVFNPLGFVRNDVADLPYDSVGVSVVDVSTGKEVPSQAIEKEGKKFLRIDASNIPSIGYKVYEVRSRKSVNTSSTITVKDGWIENRFFKLKLTPSGVITEWYDKLSANRSLLKKSDTSFVNNLGTKNLSAGTLTVENAGPVSVTVKAVANDPLPHTVRVTVFANSPRIEIEDSIRANFWNLRKWDFSFNLDEPTTHHEELGAILTAKKETRGGDYAAQNARYDWQTFNHFADLSEKHYGITVSNIDCSFFTLGHSTPDSLWETSSMISGLAGGQTDPYTGLSKNVKDTVMMGIYRQNGNQYFRYSFALTSHRSGFDPVREMKFALEHQNPLVAAEIIGKKEIASPGKFSLLGVSDPSIILWSIKPSEEGIKNGLIARLWNFGSRISTSNLSLSQPISQAWLTSHIETNEQRIKPVAGLLPVSLGAYCMNTYHLFTAKNSIH